MIRHKDFMHGAALVAIAQHRNFSALNKASGKYGHFKVNHDCHVFIKYRDESAQDSHLGQDYIFTFKEDEVRLMRDSKSRTSTVYAVLVCGDEAITALSLSQLGELIDLPPTHQQWVNVHAEPRKRLRVRGPKGQLKRPVPRKAFPDQILG